VLARLLWTRPFLPTTSRLSLVGWLPPLIASARNRKIAAGAPGSILASTGVKMLEVPLTLDRASGDVHALGNPHFLLDPLNVRIIVAQLAARFTEIAPQSAPLFKANLDAFSAMLDARLLEWQRQLTPFVGAGIATYHRDFVYLAERFKLNVVETLESKPGIAPSPAHLARVIAISTGRSFCTSIGLTRNATGSSRIAATNVGTSSNAVMRMMSTDGARWRNNVARAMPSRSGILISDYATSGAVSCVIASTRCGPSVTCTSLVP
jgi:hypothetical protein